MKKTKLIKGLLPVSVALATIPLATIATSCNKKSPEQTKDFISFDNVQKDIYGLYDNIASKRSTAVFEGFVLKEGFSVEELNVSIENSDFEGSAYPYILDNGDNTFKVYVFFKADSYLAGKKAKFDLTFTHSASSGHNQTLSSATVEFMCSSQFIITSHNFSSKQTYYTSKSNLSFYTRGYFQAFAYDLEPIEDLSDFYIEVYTASETLKANAEIVPIYNGEFAIKLNLENVTNESCYVTYIIKNKKVADWYKTFSFHLTMSTDISQGLKYSLTKGTPNTATLTGCYIEDDTVSIPNTITVDSETYNVTSISNFAFEYCFNVKEVIIPANVTNIESDQRPFGRSYIESIKVDPANTVFTSQAIYNGQKQECNCIMRIPTEDAEPTSLVAGCYKTKIADTIESIELNAFAECLGLESVTMPDNVKHIGSGSFAGCINLKHVDLNKATKIYTQAFNYCIQLNSLSFGTALAEIGISAFAHCYSLKNITIPATVTTIESSAFSYAKNIEDYVVEDGNVNYTSKDENDNQCHCIMTKSGESFTVWHGCKNTIIPETTVKIGNDCFIGIGDLKTIQLPSSVISIGDHAFYKCYDLESMDLTNVIKLGSRVFGYCSNLKTVKFNPLMETISSHCFTNCISLESIELPSACTAVNDYAFVSCTSLKTITNIEKLKTIGNHGFDYCVSLEHFTFGDALTKIGDYGFVSCYSLKEADLSKTKITQICQHCFDSCISLTEVKLPDTCKDIEIYGFEACSSLETINLSKVTQFHSRCFNGCSSLKEADLSSATELKFYAFKNCASLTKVTMGSGVTTLGNDAFNGCVMLSEIDLSHIATFESQCFYGCKNLKSVDLSSAGIIPDATFCGCLKLEKIDLSNNTILTTIGANAFTGCPITEITIPATVIKIVSSAFWLCYNLTSATFKDTSKTWKMGDTTISTEDIANPTKMAEILTTATEDLMKDTA